MKLFRYARMPSDLDQHEAEVTIIDYVVVSENGQGGSKFSTEFSCGGERGSSSWYLSDELST